MEKGGEEMGRKRRERKEEGEGRREEGGEGRGEGRRGRKGIKRRRGGGIGSHIKLLLLKHDCQTVQ